MSSRMAIRTCDAMFPSQSAGTLAYMSIIEDGNNEVPRTDIHSSSITHELNNPQVIGIHRMTARSDLLGPTHAINDSGFLPSLIIVARVSHHRKSRAVIARMHKSTQDKITAWVGTQQPTPCPLSSTARYPRPDSATLFQYLGPSAETLRATISSPI